MEELEHKHLHLLQARKIHGRSDGRIDGLISPLARSQVPTALSADLVRSDLNFPAVTRPLRGGGGGRGPPLPQSPIPTPLSQTTSKIYFFTRFTNMWRHY